MFRKTKYKRINTHRSHSNDVSGSTITIILYNCFDFAIYFSIGSSRSGISDKSFTYSGNRGLSESTINK
jgi:hypothetical protein